MAVETLTGRTDPVLKLRGAAPVRGALSVLRELKEDLGFGWDIPVEGNVREAIKRRARAAVRRVTRMRVIWPVIQPPAPYLRAECSSPARPTDIPGEWVGPDAPTTVLPDTPRNAVRNRAWNVDWFRGRVTMKIFTLDQAVSWAKARMDTSSAFIDAVGEARSIDLCARLGVWSDYIDCFGGMPTEREMGLAKAKREEAVFAALKTRPLVLVA